MHATIRLATLGFALLAVCPAMAASASDNLLRNATVRRALENIQRNDAATFREQVELAQIPAPPFKESVRAQEYLKRMQALGLKDAYIDQEGNVIGVRKGSAGKPVLAIAAHLDTVFPEGDDVMVREKDGRYYGRGLADDSLGLAAGLGVLKAMQEAGVRTVGDVIFVGSVGEEGLGDLRGVKALFRDNQQIDGFIAIDGVANENGSESIVAHATGSHRWEVTFKGPGGHSFAAFGAPSAIQAMGRAIAHISDVKPATEPKTTFTVGVVTGGTSVNTIAAEAQMLVDIRSNGAPSLLEAEKMVLAAIEKGVAEENARWGSAGIRAEPKLVGDRPAGQQQPDSPVVKAAVAARKSLGLPVASLAAASTDSNVPIGLGIASATLNGGGVGGGAHSPDEWYKPLDAWKGRQTILLTTLSLVGVEGVSKPELPPRSAAKN